jgi:hypothetical protein
MSNQLTVLHTYVLHGLPTSQTVAIIFVPMQLTKDILHSRFIILEHAANKHSRVFKSKRAKYS